LKGVIDSVSTTAFSENSKFIICGYKNIITIYRSEDMRIHKRIVLKNEGRKGIDICALAISPDSKKIAVFDENNSSVSLIDIDSNKKIDIKEASYSVPVFYDFGNKMAFISENQKGIIFVDSHNGKIEKKISDIGVELESIAFNSNGDLMITNDYEVGLYIWDIKENAKQLFPILLESRPEAVYFSADDKEIYVIRPLSKMEVFSFPPLQQLINKTRERFKNRPLTHEERLRYYLE
jgi:WD40 repeat protein